MESAELKTLIKLRKLADSVLVKKLRWIDVEIDGKLLQPTEQRAEDIATGIMVAVQAIEASAGL